MLQPGRCRLEGVSRCVSRTTAASCTCLARLGAVSPDHAFAEKNKVRLAQHNRLIIVRSPVSNDGSNPRKGHHEEQAKKNRLRAETVFGYASEMLKLEAKENAGSSDP